MKRGSDPQAWPALRSSDAVDDCETEQRYRNLIHHLPAALLQIDATPMTAIFDHLRREEVTDAASHFDQKPDLLRHAGHLVRVTDANCNAVRLFAAESAAELIGPVDFLFAASPDTAKRMAAAHFEGRRTYSERTKVRTFDGQLRDVELFLTFPAPPERLDVTLISLEDITDRLRTESQLRQLQADFLRAGRIATLGELATSIAHEVNQPLAAIVTNAETSLRWLSRDEPNLAKVEQLTRRIADSAHRAHEIVQRIRGMVGRHAPERVPLAIDAVIEESLLFVRHDLEARAIALSMELAPDLPPVAGDRVQLQQVMVNLLLNGIQAIATGPGIQGRIDLCTARDEDGAVTIAVGDNGPGIAPENLARVFEGFFTTKEDGIGIGLAICQSIIAAHGGRISVANRAYGGARFEIRLPPAP